MYEFSVDDAAGPLFFFLVYGLLFGYVYCLISELVYRIFEAVGWIGENNITK